MNRVRLDRDDIKRFEESEVTVASDLKVDQFGQTKHHGGTFHKVPIPSFIQTLHFELNHFGLTED